MLDTMGVATDTIGRTGRDVVAAGSWEAVECIINSPAKVEVLACHGLKTLMEAATEDPAGEVKPELCVMASFTSESGE